jgi:thiamine biosynthesis lipoprotein
MDADALATIALVSTPDEALALAEATPGAALRVTMSNGETLTSSRWSERTLEGADRMGARLHRAQAKTPAPAAPPSSLTGGERWPIDWRMAVWYALPERADRSADFREPYMAVWITDDKNKPVRTLFMVGQNAKWQKDNYIWWASHRAVAEDLIDARSERTAPTGRYAFMWEGRDDQNQRVGAGKYVIHVETSRERGRHTYRSMAFEIKANGRFRKTMEALPEEGGFTAIFGHYNDVYE